MGGYSVCVYVLGIGCNVGFKGVIVGKWVIRLGG